MIIPKSSNQSVFTSPILIYALSGLGKSTLVKTYPEKVYDYDPTIYTAVKAGFPNHEPRSALRAWRDLCRSAPWEGNKENFLQWAKIRQAIFNPLVEHMKNDSIDWL